MTEIGERMHGELSDLLNLIRRMGGGRVFEEVPGAFDENAEAPATSSLTQRGVIDGANKLAEALERFRAGNTVPARNVGTRSRQPGCEPHRKSQPASDVRAAWSIQHVDSRPASGVLM